VRTAKIWDGRVDVYAVEGGEILISGRGAMKALQAGDVTGSRDFSRMLERIPGKTEGLAVSPTVVIVDFVQPQGGIAKGITPSSMTNILGAYADAWLEGTLHPSQETIARNCIRILRALAKTGLAKLCEEALDIVKSSAGDWFTLFLREGLRLERATDYIWPDRFVAQYCKWNGIEWKSGQRHPLSMKNANGFFYQMVFPPHILAVIRDKRLSFGEKCRVHQTMTDKPREWLRAQLDIAVAFAETSISEQQWRRKMARFYGKDANLSFAACQ
jgi:hypothetical protein